MEVYDDEGKTPLIYAIEECNFDIVKIMRDHIFLKKYDVMKQMNSVLHLETKFTHSLQQRLLNCKPSSSSTPPKTQNDTIESKLSKNKNILKVNNASNDSVDSDSNKFTPNRIHYNYDVTSPYYINITHRRHKPQPKFPPIQTENGENEQLDGQPSKDDILSISQQNTMLSSGGADEGAVNIFSLTRDNLKELAERTAPREKSPKSLIENWREKVRESRARKSICREFDDVIEMINEVVEHDHLNFTNTKLKEKETSPEKTIPQIETEAESGAHGSTSCTLNKSTQYLNLPDKNNVPAKVDVKEMISPQKSETILSKLMQAVAEAKIQDFEADCIKSPQKPSQQPIDELESTYQTVPEIVVASPKETEGQGVNTTTNFVRSPKTNEYFLQMTEAYVHTDDENGLVFYETKLLSNAGGNQQGQQGKKW